VIAQAWLREKPVGVLLGELASLAEHDVVELEQLRVTVLDHHRRTWERGQLADLVTQLAAGEAGN
jgi:hypothetical protein